MRASGDRGRGRTAGRCAAGRKAVRRRVAAGGLAAARGAAQGRWIRCSAAGNAASTGDEASARYAFSRYAGPGRTVAAQSGEQRAGRIEAAHAVASPDFIFRHDKSHGFSVALDAEVLQAAGLPGKGTRGGGGGFGHGVIQMEHPADQGGSGDCAHDDPGWGEQRGKQQTEQADATGS
ncbi:MAG: hypothetical protein A2X71_03280 [Thiobacillus sp. GWE1_62_9]|nr:MAG: hypothetical protein A2X71_03280 [Thiobacillus sp. GWE1_62_9]HBU29295.1 hypothetical protein [Thiobacillus sp.]